MNSPNWSDLAAAYALDALDAEERQAFEDRLARDPGLQDEVDSYREVMGLLADTAPRSPAPSSLKDRVLAEARTIRPIAAVEPTAPEKAPRPSSPSRLPWYLAAAASVAALALGLANRQLSQSQTELESELARADQQVSEQTVAIAARDSLLDAFLGPDVRSVTLVSTDAPPAAQIFHNPVSGSLVFAAYDLPPAAAGRVYQFWGIPDGGDPVSLGTFQTEADGTALIRTTTPAGIDFAVGAVTEEPAGGSPQPTTTPFLVGSWAQQ